MTKTRRDILKGSMVAGAVPVLPVPAGPVPGLVDIVTLGRLAAEGKFASVDIGLPEDVMSADFTFFLDGHQLPADKLMVREIYAPGDDAGWVVAYKRDQGERWRGETELIRGRWTFTKTPRTG